jgi:hypothetical protein
LKTCRAVCKTSKWLACGLVLAAAAAGAADPPPPAPGWAVKVHLLSSDERVELQDENGQTVCKTPCDAPIQVRDGEEFKVNGTWLRSSHPIIFNPADSQVTLRVDARTLTPRIVGLGIMAGGLATILSAAVGLGLNSASCALQYSCASVSTSGPLAIGGAGLGVLILGGMIALGAPRTEVSRVP